MLTVKTPEEVYTLLRERFPAAARREMLPLEDACGRILYEDIKSTEYVPSFHRSTVDGYAVRSADTFGCSDAIPALLPLEGEVLMGEQAEKALSPGSCMAVPTGGALPEGAGAVVMVEYTEDYGDGTIGILKSAAPGNNLIFKGDDVFPGKVVLPAGWRLTAQDIGALAAMGVTEVPVSQKPLVGILSTGDELVPVNEMPREGQVRDVNSAMLRALCMENGAVVKSYGIFKDEEALLSAAVDKALAECDVVLISGGSSVGMKDATCRVIESKGELLLHGIAMKPGKPTILGKVEGKPIAGLPGHPVAAFFVSHLFIRPLLQQLMGREIKTRTVTARLAEAISANHGRAEYMGVHLEERADGLYARPIHGKSGLITTLAASDGYLSISRDCEGLAKDAPVPITIYCVD